MKNQIQNTRSKLNMSREELATRAEISANSLRELEYGKVTPSVGLAMKIAEILHSSVEKLFRK